MAVPHKGTGASSAKDDWNAIDWRAIQAEVGRLQARIAKAEKEKHHGKVKSLQWLLVHSWFGKLWATRRVVINNGKRTPGVDGVIWRTPREKMEAARSLNRKGYQPQPLRRIYIPKKNGKLRPLSIPTMQDRAMQALYLLALNPVAEIRADPNSYGFRPYRSTADALGQCFIVLAKKHSPVIVFEGDIEACFDRISHEWLLANIPMDTAILRKWLACGYLEDSVFHSTEEGTPQGGIISPVLANLVLDGLERVAHDSVPKKSCVNVVRYADDFIITARNEELLTTKILPAVTAFLAERGLRLSPEKSKITNMETGFDFLGANIRKYDGKLLMQPSQKSVKAVTENLREFIKAHPEITLLEMIRRLNSRLRGWANYFKGLVSGKAFAKVDTVIYWALWRWAKRKHPQKPAYWLLRKYTRRNYNGTKVFSALMRKRNGQTSPIDLFRATSLGTQRHVKVLAQATAYDDTYTQYFRERWIARRRIQKARALRN